jgi:hypothetical protein
MARINREYDISSILNIPLQPLEPLKPASSNLSSLASLWAKSYIHNITQDSIAPDLIDHLEAPLAPTFNRETTAIVLLSELRLAIAQAWMQTELMLHDQFMRHGINPTLIDPLVVAIDTENIFTKIIQAYGAGIATEKLTLLISDDCSALRAKYTEKDARLMGFISLQCHYMGRSLLSHLSNVEKLLFGNYLKTLNDHLAMPLREMYLTAASHDSESEALRAVQRLLPISSKIARKVYKRVREQYPGYESYSGRLNSEQVRISSIRDIELFQIYLCLCLLEGNIRSIQQQLFPICVMLYPALSVKWELVQSMINHMGWEMHKKMLPSDMMQFLPYLRTLEHMFSPEVFDDWKSWSHAPKTGCFRSVSCSTPDCM